jgi:hypothetical protein
VPELLGRHKSWACRRLALIERLGPKAKDELRVGLLTPTAARQIVRLRQGNQTEVLELPSGARRCRGAEPGGVVNLWLDVPNDASKSISWRILGKRSLKPWEYSRRCAIRG